MPSWPVTHTDTCSPMACNVTCQAGVEDNDLFFRVVGRPKATQHMKPTAAVDLMLDAPQMPAEIVWQREGVRAQQTTRDAKGFPCQRHASRNCNCDSFDLP